MALIALFENKDNFESDDIDIVAKGPVRILVRGDLGLRGTARVLIKGPDGVFHEYTDLTFRGPSRAVEATFSEGDTLRVQFQNCKSATVELTS